MFMRFYYGPVYNVGSAVKLTAKGFYYYIQNIKNDKKQCPAYVKCGLDRELRVGNEARLILYNQEKQKIIKIPFEKDETGRLIFDLSAYFDQQKLPHKIYKYPSPDCHGNRWNWESFLADFCKNGTIMWNSISCVDYTEYSFSAEYPKKLLFIDGNPVQKISIDRALWDMDTKEIREWFEASYQEEKRFSFKEFGHILDSLGINKENHFLEIQFLGGMQVSGSKIDWTKQ